MTDEGPSLYTFDGAGSKDQKGGNGKNLEFTPDSNGAIGKAFYVELINNAFAIYDRAGGVRQAPVSTATFWAAAGVPSDGFDPRIAYLPNVGLYGQWLAVELGGDGVMIATTDPAAQGDDPSLGKWKASQFPLAGRDFPMLGYDKNGVYIGIESSLPPPPPPPITRSPQIILIPRAKALAYPPQVGPDDIKIIGPLRVEDYGCGLFPVIDQSGQETPVATFIGVDAIAQNALTFVLVSPASGKIVQHGRIPVKPFTALAMGNRVKQPSFSDGVIFGNSNIISAPICDGSNIWVTHTVQWQDGQYQKSLAVRWYRLSIDAASRVPSLAASGEIFESNYDYFNSAIQSFGQDDYIVLSLSRSGTYQTPRDPKDPKCGNIGAYAAVFRETDTSPQILTLKSGLSDNYINNTTSERWGDYSTVCRDPTSPRQVWMVNQYVLQGGSGTSQWCTAIGALNVPPS